MSKLKMNCGYCGRKCDLDKDFCIPQDSVYVCKSCYAWQRKVSDLEAKLAEKEHSIGMLNQHLTDKAIEIERFGEELAESEKKYNDLKEIDDATNESLYASREFLDELKSEKWALEKQLAEYEKEFMDNEKCFTEKDVEGLIKDREETINFLKQQLAEKEKEIESFKFKLELRAMNLHEINMERVALENQVKNHDQDKIELLEKVKYSVLDFSNGYWRYFMKNGKEYMTSSDLESCLNETIDTLISEIKG